eukprot:CAMPEP_0194525894 /NCGR_PEP_ID=MMETSP0253-20130528/61541_1 /TAXON_ID=2966 /ORGANISM="Noctiluca scintillans" /LENGTH=273 /DNA_ID=CAMNT_0039370671 /DNA_START=31 /DNA_END=853 /DNA_ORIENTATION=-
MSILTSRGSVSHLVREIPDRLLFNYKTNLLLGRSALPHHSANVNRTIHLHPGAEVVFSTDADCRASIARVHSEELARYFDREHIGAYKSDLCRLATLYEGGGYYFDNDFEVYQDARKVIPANASLSTVLELGNRQNIFQAFLAATPQHPTLMSALDETCQKYREKYGSYNLMLRSGQAANSEWLGPVVFGDVLRGWLGRTSMALGSAGSAYLFEESQDLSRYGLNDVVARAAAVTSWSAMGKTRLDGLALSVRVNSVPSCDLVKCSNSVIKKA